MRHVVADGEDERLVVLRQDDRIVDQPAKFKDSEEGRDEPGKMKLSILLNLFSQTELIFGEQSVRFVSENFAKD